VNATARDYHLSDQSALIDVGVTVAGLTQDREGTARPQGASYDVGAYELVPDTVNAEVSLQNVTANGRNLLQLTYEIIGGAAIPFDISFYSSADASYSTTDTLLDTYRLTAVADLAAGVHTINLPIGAGSNEIALPGAGASENGADYYLIAYADAGTELAGDTSDNFGLFSGIYHLNGGKVFVHGTELADKLVVQPSGLHVSLNGLQYVYSDSATPAVEARLYGGDDVLTGGGGNDLLSGGTGNDVYRFDADKKSGVDTIVESAVGGNDTFDFSTTTKHSISVNLSSNTSIVNTLFTVVLATAKSIENVGGGLLNDTINGTDSSNRLNGGGGMTSWMAAMAMTSTCSTQT
jgi:hypothetical protein